MRFVIVWRKEFLKLSIWTKINSRFHYESNYGEVFSSDSITSYVNFRVSGSASFCSLLFCLVEQKQFQWSIMESFMIHLVLTFRYFIRFFNYIIDELSTITFIGVVHFNEVMMISDLRLE